VTKKKQASKQATGWICKILVTQYESVEQGSCHEEHISGNIYANWTI